MNILVCGMRVKICIEVVSKRPGGIFFLIIGNNREHMINKENNNRSHNQK